jgi:hypothetical protein
VLKHDFGTYFKEVIDKMHKPERAEVQDRKNWARISGGNSTIPVMS